MNTTNDTNKGDAALPNVDTKTMGTASPTMDYPNMADVIPTAGVSKEDVQSDDEEEHKSKRTAFVTECPELNYPKEEQDDSFTKVEGKRKRRYLGVPITTFNVPNIPVMEAVSELGSDTYKLTPEQYSATLFHHTPQSIFEDMGERKGNWSHTLTHNNKKLDARLPRIGGDLHGSAAVERMRRQCGTGQSHSYPLLHSGIWITMDPPSETEIINLDMQLSMEAADIGLNTSGLLLNARSGVFANSMINFALEHVVATNVKNQGNGRIAALKERIDKLDYPALIWGIMTAWYPDGYPWELRCGNPECNAIHSNIILNFRRCHRKDLDAITDEQKDILYKYRDIGISDEDIIKYKSLFKLTDKDSFLFEQDDVRIYFKRSSLTEYTEQSQLWVNDIQESYAKSLQRYQTEAQRNSFIVSQSQTRRMSKYAHMVEKIEFVDTDEVIENSEDIRNALNAMHADDAEFLLMEEAALDYIQANTVAMIGYVSNDCNVCNIPFVNKDNTRFKTIVPLPIDRIFFTLVQQKSSVIAELAKI